MPMFRIRSSGLIKAFHCEKLSGEKTTTQSSRAGRVSSTDARAGSVTHRAKAQPRVLDAALEPDMSDRWHVLPLDVAIKALRPSCQLSRRKPAEADASA